MPKPKAANTKKYLFAVGRRRESTASLKLFKGKENSVINTLDATVYFSDVVSQKILFRPLALFDLLEKHYFSARVSGGGKRGQLGALRLALARAVNQLGDSYRPILKKEKLLTVDSRVRERRMIGTGGKARRQKQSPKR